MTFSADETGISDTKQVFPPEGKKGFSGVADAMATIDAAETATEFSEEQKNKIKKGIADAKKRKEEEVKNAAIAEKKAADIKSLQDGEAAAAIAIVEDTDGINVDSDGRAIGVNANDDGVAVSEGTKVLGTGDGGRGTINEEPGARGDALRKRINANKEQDLVNRNQGQGGNNAESTKKTKKPFQTLDGLAGDDPFRFTSLAYPLDVTTDMTNGHYILFYVNVQNKTKYSYNGYNDDGHQVTIGDVVEYQDREYEDPGLRQRIEAGTVSQTEVNKAKYKTKYIYSTGADAGDVPYLRRQIASGKKGNILQSNQVTLMRQRTALSGLQSQLDLTSRITDSVALYLPAAASNDTTATYQASETGMAGYLALSGGSVLEKIRTHDFEGAADEFMGMGGTILYDMIRKAGIGAFGAATGGQGVQANFDKAFGQTMNPFIEVAFDSMGVRNFEYTFDFRPRSSDESAEVHAIIQLFRFHMVPEMKGTNHRYLTLPSTFDIHYMYQTSPETAKENSFYHKIATCVLTDCRVNYTPDGVKSFESGAPTHTTMTLAFKETEMLTKEKVQQGF